MKPTQDRLFSFRNFLAGSKFWIKLLRWRSTSNHINNGGFFLFCFCCFLSFPFVASTNHQRHFVLGDKPEQLKDVELSHYQCPSSMDCDVKNEIAPSKETHAISDFPIGGFTETEIQRKSDRNSKRNSEENLSSKPNDVKQLVMKTAINFDNTEPSAILRRSIDAKAEGGSTLLETQETEREKNRHVNENKTKTKRATRSKDRMINDSKKTSGGINSVYEKLSLVHNDSIRKITSGRIKRQNSRQYGNRNSDPEPIFDARRISSHLKLNNGLYEGLVVKIHEKIPQEDCREVIEGLQASLKELSSTLYLSTDGRAALGRVTIILSPDWSSRTCNTHAVESSSDDSAVYDAQIFVNPSHSLFGDAPWTQQSAGCGIGGDFISLGVNFLKEAGSSSELAIRAGRVLAGEWAKYRWGVFSEVGHSGDPLYPPWYLHNGDWTPTLCSDISSHSLPCHPELSHRCPWPPKELVNATSSLLSTPNLPQVNLFCNRRTHNSRAPTKQNNLCLGKSAWEVIAASTDFSDGRNPPGIAPLRPPQIIFVKQSPLKFVILVEDTAVMNEQRRWEFVRKAVRRTVVYDLPDEAYVSVVVFNSQPTEVAPLSKLESDSDLRERVGSSLPRNPSTVRASQACIVCALDAAIKVINNANLSEKGANIVLLTSGGQSRVEAVDGVTNLMQNHGLKLQLVFYPFQEYPGRPAPINAMVPIARNSGGSVFTVMDEGVGNDSKVSMLVALMEALTAAVAAGGAITPVLVHLKTYPGGLASLSTGTFSLDDSLAANAKFAVYYYDLNHVGNTIHLTAPSGDMFASVSMQEEDGDVNMIFVNLHNAERGDWSYKVENRADSHQGLHIQVTSLSNPANHVKVRVWTNQHTEIPSTSDEGPIIIYGEVKVNGFPVIDAGVMAILQRLGTNATGGTYRPVRVALLDLGTGDPDITKGDGIYTRYVPPLEGPARYSLVLYVDARNSVIGQTGYHEHDHRHHRRAYSKENYVKKASEATSAFPYSSASFSYGLASSISSSFYSYYDNPSRRGWENGASSMEPSGCCGSTLQFQHTRLSPPFTRQVTGPTIDFRTVNSVNANRNQPARIFDLIAWVNSSTGMIVLEWTAVGNNYDWGRAKRYEGAATYSLEQARHHCSGHILKSLPEPADAGTKQSVSLPLEINEKKTVYICMLAVSDSGSKGPPGNAAAVWLPKPPSMDRVTVRARESGFGSYGSSAIGEKAAVISGIIGGILLVVVIIVAYCYCVPVASRRRFKRRRQEVNGVQTEEKSPVSGGDGNLINGGSVVMKSQSRKSILTADSNCGNNNAARCDTNDIEIVPAAQRRESDLSDRGGSQETLRLSVLEEATTPKQLDAINDGKRTLSMSIPDVTRVDTQKSNITSSQAVPSNANQNPQFFTLGRRALPSTTSSHPFFDVERNPAECQQQPCYSNNTLKGSQKVLNEVHFPKVSGPKHNLTASGQGNPFISGYCPPIPSRRISMHESDSSLYGSTEGDSGVLLCDDRTSSPPPPAPTGPQDPVAFRVSMPSVGFP